MRLQMFRACSTLSKGKPFYITTPIFYVNAAPHIGHLYSALIADARFRFESLINNTSNQVFSTGTDEHGLKIQQAASGKGVAVNEYCERIATEYKKLFNTAKVDFTHFIRTTEKDHETAVHNFWNKLNEGGHIYSSNYSGWYCVSDETFLTDSQLKEVNGKKVSVESGHEVEWAEEKNYIFKLSKYQDDVIHWIKSGNRIRPAVFEKILLDSLAEPLPDVSISRPVSRVDWAVRVPNDDTQSVYVWLDALVNYLTVIGYPNDRFKDLWPADVQVIGKDILKFHGIYWPAFLIAAGLEPPKSLFVHSHWTIEGQKMSKSKFNVIDPTERASTYTFEGLRYFLLREGVAHNDGNYSDVKVLRILNSELADTLGNLMSRCCGKALNPKQLVPEPHHQHLDKLLELDVTKKLQLLLNEVPSKCYDHYYAMNYYLAINEVMAVLHATNNFVEVTKPWELKKGTPDQIELLETILSVAFESLKICGIILQPIIPDISNSLLDKISVPKNERKWCSTDTEMFSKSNIINSRLLGNGPTGLFKRIVLEKKTKASN